MKLFALCLMMSKAHGRGTIPKCKAKTQTGYKYSYFGQNCKQVANMGMDKKKRKWGWNTFLHQNWLSMEIGLLFCFSWIWFVFPSPLVTKFGFCSTEGSDLGPLSLALFVPSFHLLLGVLTNEVCPVQFSSPFHPCLFLVSSISIPLWVWWWWVFHFAKHPCTGQVRTAAGRPTSKAGNDVLWTTTKHNFSPYQGIDLVNNILECLEHYAGYCTKDDGTSQAAAPLGSQGV